MTRHPTEDVIDDVRTTPARLYLARRLVRHHGLTPAQAFTALDKLQRGDHGEFTDLARDEAFAVLEELSAALAPLRQAFVRFVPELASLGDALSRTASQLQRGKPDRPAWATPYGPPARRRTWRALHRPAATGRHLRRLRRRGTR